MRISSLGLIILSGVTLSACSSTPDRYAFWRDDAPASSPVTINAAKPNLGDIPAAPDVTTARQEMEDLQTRLAADRQSAYQQAQNDQNPMALTTPRGSAVTVSDPALPGSINNNSINAEILPSPSTLAMANIQTVPPAAPSLIAPAMINPNREATAPGLPVFTPPSVSLTPPVQVNRVVNPLPQQGEIGPYIYGRSGVQYRQRMNQQAALTPPTPGPAAMDMPNDRSITVDMSALGGASLGGGNNKPFAMRSPAFAPTGAPVIYFNHGSSRLSSNDRKTLSSLANAAATGRTVKVIGHASKRAATVSPLAAKEANLKISATRAAAVMKELAKNGVAAKQIEPIAVGDSDAQLGSNEKAARRVDIIVE